ncbi:MAG: GTPase Era [Candidatus Wallacebacter cryptica]|jgi:GTP-binding protein Era|nr:GTPase Era [Bacillota bacterium]
MTVFKSGFAAVIGRPNVGKSTLLNSLLDQKISIVSDKPQTTRNTIQAILTRSDAQIVFLDTPGIHRPLHKLGEYMVKSAKAALEEVDVICFMVEVTGWRKADEEIIAELGKIDTPVFLVINKVDLVSDEEQANFLRMVENKYDFAEIFVLSALERTGLNQFVETLVSYLPEGPKYYPDDWVTDHPERFVMAEFIREQILHNTEEEIPHSVAVDIDEVKADPEKDLVLVRATIYVERDSQKGIIIGKRGSMLKKIGIGAREHIETLLGSQVYLDLWVKVKKDWRNKSGSLSEFGYQ